MNVTLLTPISAVLGILLGAFLQYLFNIRIQNAKQFQEIRNLAYTDFIKSFASMVLSQKAGNKEEEYKATVLFVDAKARISVYGSNKVVESLVILLDTYQKVETHESFELFSKVIQAMRSETSKKEMISSSEIVRLLF